MNFYNFFTNLNTSNLEALNLTTKISKILINDKGEHYSSLTDFTSDNISEEVINPPFIKNLNPTLFEKKEKRTLPIVNFLWCGTENGSFYNNSNPSTVLNGYLNPTSRRNSHHSRLFDDETTRSYETLFGYQSCRDPLYLFKQGNRSPNTFFLKLLKEFKNTHEISTNYSINKNTHKALLEEGYVCWVDSLEHSTALNDSKYVSSLRNIAQQYIATFNYILKVKNGTVAELPDQDPGKRMWNNLLFIDNSPSFSHLEFERPTQTLLLLEDEEIQNYIDMFLSLKVFNYLKMNSLTKVNDIPIYSHFSKQFFEKFLKDLKSPNQENYHNLQVLESPPMCFQLAPTESQHQWEFSSLFNSRISGGSVMSLPVSNSNQSYVPFGGTSGFLIHNLTNTDKFNNLNVCNSIERSPGKRITGLMLNGFTKRTTKADIEFTSLTKKQALIRKGFFIPVLLNFAIYNKDCDFELAQNFCLLNYSDDLNQIKKRKRSRMEFHSLYKKYGEDGLMIVNYENFLINQAKLMKNLSEYSIVNATTFAELSKTDITSLIQALSVAKKTINEKVNDSVTDFSDKITSKLIINPTVVKKYSKVNNYYNKLVSENDETKLSFNGNAYNLGLTQVKLCSNLTKIQSLQKEILELKKNFISDSNSLRNSFNKRVDLIKSLCTNQALYLAMSKRYNDAVEVALKENNYASNSFFKNLHKNESIKIISIKANQADLIDSNLSQVNLDKFSSSIISKTKKFVIDEVEFLIDKPVKILVDAGSKGEVAAGPYLLKVNKNRINIALAYPSSIHGMNLNTIYVHPHASSFNIDALVSYFTTKSTRYSSGCLGEASALIYKAFEKNDLKSIIISTLTWVKNANSADPWGRNYKFFPKYAEMIKGKPSLTAQDERDLEDEITEDEVETFINTMIEDTTFETAEPLPVEEQTEPEIEIQPNLRTQEEQINVQQVNGIETFNTDEAYIPYTQR